VDVLDVGWLGVAGTVPDVEFSPHGAARGSSERPRVVLVYRSEIARFEERECY
jgi:hypothetical protein